MPLLTDERPDLGSAGVVAALASLALLVGDVVLPVPSSGVMLVNGALFGPLAGAALSLAGSTGGAALGWAIGRRGERLLDRFVGPAERARREAYLERQGSLAVVLSRPVPVLAETISILAGAVGMAFGRFLALALAGSIPPAVVYAIVGASATDSPRALLVFLGLVGVAALVWLWVGARTRTRTAIGDAPRGRLTQPGAPPRSAGDEPRRASSSSAARERRPPHD